MLFLAGALCVWAAMDVPAQPGFEIGPGRRAGSIEFSDLFAVAGSSAEDVFAVGAEGAVWHFDGQRWSELPIAGTETLRGVWAAGAGEAFVVGDGGTVMQCSTSTCNVFYYPATTANLDAVWGDSTSDVFAAGSNGTIIHYNGVKWSVQLSGVEADFGALRGFSSHDVYAVGSAVYHFNGVAWTPVESEQQSSSLPPWILAVWGTSDKDLYVAGWRGQFGIIVPVLPSRGAFVESVTSHFDGTRWRVVETQHGAQVPLAVIAGAAGDTAVAATQNGAFMRFDGSKWNVAVSAQELHAAGVEESGWGAMCALPSGEIFAVGPRGAILDLLP